jgi:hypothetical protein
VYVVRARFAACVALLAANADAFGLLAAAGGCRQSLDVQVQSTRVQRSPSTVQQKQYCLLHLTQ